jgi:hypothetical protein
MKMYENLDISNLDGEIWKNIKDYKGLYQVSNFGRVKSLKFEKEIILKQQKNKNGYFRICLYKNGKFKHKLVHRLVYETHKGNLEKGNVIHHINKNKEYNFIENLESKECGKHTEYHNDGRKHSEETRRKISKSHRLPNQKITDIETDIKIGKLTRIEMIKKHNISQSTISRYKNLILK